MAVRDDEACCSCAASSVEQPDDGARAPSVVTLLLLRDVEVICELWVRPHGFQSGDVISTGTIAAAEIPVRIAAALIRLCRRVQKYF